MKVICTKILSMDGTETYDSNPSITLGAEYLVTSLLAYSNRPTQLQILTDDGNSLVWHDSRSFVTSDGSIPDGWEARINDEGTLELAPSSWFVVGLWEDYYDGDPEAAHVVAAELNKMFALERNPDSAPPKEVGPSFN
ncbi:hypothetical protein ABIA52_004244 [Paenarthrobacter histidinolovorans]|uniref:Uncharacterized protein n=1 Tax=Paenarthrobacter histidinolovorans TaxID=43664 RepID=A0ABW8NCR3_9MICC